MYKTDFDEAIHMGHWDYVKGSIRTFGTNRSISPRFFVDQATILVMDTLRVPRRRELFARTTDARYTKDQTYTAISDMWQRYAEGADAQLEFEGFTRRDNMLAARYTVGDATVDIDAIKLKTIAKFTKGTSPLFGMRTKPVNPGNPILSAIILGNNGGMIMPLRPEKKRR